MENYLGTQKFRILTRIHNIGPHQYELKQIKTHEMRAKNFRVILFSVHCTQKAVWETLTQDLKAINLEQHAVF